MVSNSSSTLRRRNNKWDGDPAYLPTQGSSDYSRNSGLFNLERLSLSRQALLEDQMAMDSRRKILDKLNPENKRAYLGYLD